MTTSVYAPGTRLIAGFLGVFGHGNFKVFSTYENYFTVPENITKIRARCIGSGGVPGSSGGVPGSSASLKSSVNRGATEFLNATGGNYMAPGTGTGGDFNATGGIVGNLDVYISMGGGGAGSQLGDGGKGSNTTPNDAVNDIPGGVGKTRNSDIFSSSNILAPSTWLHDTTLPLNVKKIYPFTRPERFPFEFFGNTTGDTRTDAGGNGGVMSGVIDAAGHGCGASNKLTQNTNRRSAGIGGGGVDYGLGAGAGGGYSHKVITVTPGDILRIIVALPGVNALGAPGDGLVILEW